MKLTTSLRCLALLIFAPIGLGLAQDKAAPTNTAKPNLPTYRVTYTLTEVESGKRVGLQHFSMTTIAGQIAVLKLGSKVAVMNTYMDVGLNITVNLNERSNGVELDTQVEQSSLEDSPKAGAPPIVRQAQLRNTALLQPGKPVQLGSLDVPGSTHHLDVEVVLEKIS